MAFQLLKKTCSLFCKHSSKKEEEEAPSFHTVNGVFGDWLTTAVEDFPPPYALGPENKTYLSEEHAFPPPPPPPFANPCLQICSHETLSFEALQKIATSLAISNSGETIDALQSCDGRHSHFESTANNAKYVCRSSLGLLRGSGTYASERSKNRAHTPVVALSFQWDLGSLAGVRAQVENAAELQHFLSRDCVWLCAHKGISDYDIINAIYGFVKRRSTQKVITSCDRCGTEIRISATMERHDETCRVSTKRYLGTAKEADDTMWLVQCGI